MARVEKRSESDRAPGRPGAELARADHEFMLSNGKANRGQATEAVARAMVNLDLTREEAEDLYGVKGRDAGEV